jgi:hypothetical protein
LRVVEGQEDPVQGWLPAGGNRVKPAPVGIISASGVTREMLYVLAPSAKGAADPVRAVEPLDGDPRAARVTFADGRVFEVRFQQEKAQGSWRHE